MYYRYYALTGSFDFDFVYDDTDESVELVEVNKLYEYDIKIIGAKEWTGIKRGGTNWGRLKLLGFTEVFSNGASGLELIVCSWHVKKQLCSLIVCVDNMDTYVVLDFEEYVVELTNYALRNIHLFSYYHDFCKVIIDIPFQMLRYILHLKSERDFDGLMSCFGDLLWKRVSDLFLDIKFENLWGVEWE